MAVVMWSFPGSWGPGAEMEGCSHPAPQVQSRALQAPGAVPPCLTRGQSGPQSPVQPPPSPVPSPLSSSSPPLSPSPVITVNTFMGI